jgi:hypothetical protein
MSSTDRESRRALVHQARQAVRALPETRAEYDRVQRARRQPWTTPLPITIVIALAAILVLVVTLLSFRMLPVSGIYARLGADGVFVVTSAVQSIVACAFAVNLHRLLRTSLWLTVTSHLPESDRHIAWRAWLLIAGWSSLGLYLALWALSFVAYAEKLGPTGWCIAMTIAVAQWLVAIGTGTLLVVYWPSFPASSVAMSGILAIVLYYAVGVPELSTVASVVYAAVPAGWLNAAFARGYLQGATWAWIALVPAVVVVAAGVAALRKLQEMYSIHGFTFRSGTMALAASDFWSARASSLDCRFFPNVFRFFADPPVDRLAAIRDQVAVEKIRRILSTAAPATRRRRVLDRLQRRFLTRRQSDLLDYMTADSLAWNYIYPYAVLVNIAVIPLHWVFPSVPGQPGLNLAPFMISILSFAYLFMRGGNWFGFSAPFFGGACVPRFALLPIGFDEISRLIVKLACFRAVLLAPMFLAMAFHCAAPFGGSWFGAALNGMIFAFVYLAGQGWLIAIRFAETMNSPKPRLAQLHWRLARAATGVLGVVFLFLIAYAVLSSGMILLEEAGLIGVASLFLGGTGLLFATSPLIAWLMVRAMYRRGVVDLVRARPSMSQQTLQSYEQMWSDPRRH